MKHDDRHDHVASVIDANSQRVTIQQLVARGKSHVRVISKKKTLELIEAVVADAIRSETAKVVDVDRGRIVEEANRRFEQVSRIQADSEARIREQNELIAHQQAQIQRLEKAKVELEEQYKAQGPPAEWENTVRLQAEALEQAQQRLQEAAGRQQKSASAIKRLGHRLGNARETIINYDREFDRLVAQVKEDTQLIEQLRSQLQNREHELGRVKGLLEALGQEVSAARSRGAPEPESIQELRGELGEVKAFLKSLENENGQAVGSTVEALLEKIVQKETAAKEQIEDRFQSKLNDTLDKIGQAIHVATARAVDRPVEATDVYISKVFDDEAAMDSNLQSLDVQATTAKQSISKSLERLKELRGQASQAIQEAQEEDQTEKADGL